MKAIRTVPVILVCFFTIGFFFTSCKENNREQEVKGLDEQMEARTEEVSDKIYRAQITSLNESANQDRSVSGNITLTIQGDQLQISVEASGLEPNMMHLQHLHGTKEGDETNCPDPAALPVGCGDLIEE